MVWPLHGIGQEAPTGCMLSTSGSGYESIGRRNQWRKQRTWELCWSKGGEIDKPMTVDRKGRRGGCTKIEDGGGADTNKVTGRNNHGGGGLKEGGHDPEMRR